MLTEGNEGMLSAGSPGELEFALEAIARSAASLNSVCSFDEADELLRTAMLRYPREPLLAEHHAGVALQRGDWNSASQRATNGQMLFPERPACYRIGLQANYELLHLEEATALQQQAESLFPSEAWPLMYGAHLAEARAEWVEAEGYWAKVCERFPTYADGWLEKANFYLRSGRLEAAAQILRAGIQCFPDDARLYICSALIARRSGLFAEAARRWERAVDRFPNDPIVAHYYAEAPVDVPKERQWDLALLRYDNLHRKFPDFAAGYVGHVMLLTRSGDIEGAEKLAATSLEALRASGQHVELALEYANILERRGEVQRATIAVSALTSDQPNSVLPYVALSALLSRSARFDEAEAVCQRAITRFKFRAPPLAEYARIAAQRGNLDAALERWSRAASLVPRDKVIARELFLTRLAVAESGDQSSITTSLRAIGNEQRRGSISNIMMQFESLGGPGGGGCEFGLVQRNFGAEPIGLLRWASLSTKNLIAALNSRLEGIGTSDQTLLVPPENARGETEYLVRDARFKIRMHTFSKEGDIAPEKLHQQWCARLKFLARKLIADLETGKKIFLYRPGVLLTAPEIDELNLAMRRYGDNFLLLIQTEDPSHRNGTVEFVSPHVMIGYIDRLNWEPKRATYQPSFASWARLCTRALAVCEGFDINNE
jgi:tetratricopeptide (TPR) repeat protein